MAAGGVTLTGKTDSNWSNLLTRVKEEVNPSTPHTASRPNTHWPLHPALLRSKASGLSTQTWLMIVVPIVSLSLSEGHCLFQWRAACKHGLSSFGCSVFAFQRGHFRCLYLPVNLPGKQTPSRMSNTCKSERINGQHTLEGKNLMGNFTSGINKVCLSLICLLLWVI